MDERAISRHLWLLANKQGGFVSLKKISLRTGAFIFIAQLAVGCKGNSVQESGRVELASAESVNSTEVSLKPVSLLKALPEDITCYKKNADKEDKGKSFDGSNKKQKVMRVEICHVPPGNPANKKTLIISLQAIVAHLKHGSKKHDHQDYMGPCLEDYGSGEEPTDDVSNDDVIIVDNEEDLDLVTDGDNSDESSESDGGTSEEYVDTGGGSDIQEDIVPEWCVLNYHKDSNCDGFDDTTGDSLY